MKEVKPYSWSSSLVDAGSPSKSKQFSLADVFTVVSGGAKFGSRTKLH